MQKLTLCTFEILEDADTELGENDFFGGNTLLTRIDGYRAGEVSSASG
jgi:hypothetical protein